MSGMISISDEKTSLEEANAGEMLSTAASGSPSSMISISDEKTSLEEANAGEMLSTAASGSPSLELKSLSVADNVYRMNYTNPGYLVIIGNETFNTETKVRKREGTKEDEKNLQTSFEGLGFKVEKKTNLKRSQMLELIKEVSLQDYSDYACCGVVILSHGNEGTICGTDGSIEIERLFEPFKVQDNKTLHEKPKIFIIQACRGMKRDHGCELPCDADEPTEEKVYTVPVEADFLYIYSVVPGYRSYRHVDRGSVFIQALCKVLREVAHNKDFLHVLTRMNHEIAYESNIIKKESMNVIKQASCFVSTLTKHLIFNSTMTRGPLPNSNLQERTPTQALVTGLNSLVTNSPEKMPIQETTPEERPGLSISTDDKCIYPMVHKRRGNFVIIYNENFEAKTQMKERLGTEKDASNLKEELKKLGFGVRMKKDLKVKKMLRMMKRVAEWNYSDRDCCGIAVLSHGSEGVVYGTDGPIEIERLIQAFKRRQNIKLYGKPKLFIIQACRGTQLGDDAKLQSDADKPSKKKSDTIPLEADFLYVYSTVPGYSSWRDPTEGSWFIQALCDMLEKTASEVDFLGILTGVINKVANEFGSDERKQVPCFISTLTKNLIFNKKPDY